MRFTLKQDGPLVAIHLLAFNAFGITYKMSVSAGKDGDMVIYELQDDLPSEFYYDLGLLIARLTFDIGKVLMGNIWPMPLKQEYAFHA
jgi:hypothetical protein